MITVNNVLRVFPGAIVVRLDLVCEHCGDKARIVKAVWPNRERWQCHFCGREANPAIMRESSQKNFRGVIS